MFNFVFTLKNVTTGRIKRANFKGWNSLEQVEKLVKRCMFGYEIVLVEQTPVL